MTESSKRYLVSFLVSCVCHAALFGSIAYWGQPKPFKVVSEVSIPSEVVSEVSTSVQAKTIPASIVVESRDFANTFFEMLRLVQKESVVVYYEGGHVQGAELLNRGEAAGKSLRRASDDKNVHVEVFDPGHPLHARLTRLLERDAHDEKIEAVIAAFKKSPTFDTRFSTTASLKK